MEATRFFPGYIGFKFFNLSLHGYGKSTVRVEGYGDGGKFESGDTTNWGTPRTKTHVINKLFPGLSGGTFMSFFQMFNLFRPPDEGKNIKGIKWVIGPLTPD